jgi:UDP-N-acetylglucosamine 4,6-dehydratase
MPQPFDKRALNFLVIFVLTSFSLHAASYLFEQPVHYSSLLILFGIRCFASLFLFSDFSLSWSRASTKTGIIKIFIGLVSFIVSIPLIYKLNAQNINIYIVELIFYLFSQNSLLYSYRYFIKQGEKKTKNVIIFGAGNAGMKIQAELLDTEYRILHFIDDNKLLQSRSIDSILILSKEKSQREILKLKHNGIIIDLIIIAMPSAPRKRIETVFSNFSQYTSKIKILPPLDLILQEKPFKNQLKDMSLEELLARHLKDLDKNRISDFIYGNVILVTGAGGSIGSEICRQCTIYGAKKIILLDHSEYNLFSIHEELQMFNVIPVLQSVLDLKQIEKTFSKHKPDIVIHAAAYKHVPLVEHNIFEAIKNNIVGTKNCIDLSKDHNVKKFVLISTDKAVRPTNVMGTTKRICELYAQNSTCSSTEIVAVRFGNVLGSSGSVIPKFKKQIELGKNITVTDPNITRYFMLIPEACELVLQAGALGKGGEIFILDMGEPIKIVDLANRMIQLCGHNDINIEYSGLRPGEKLYEELLISDTDKKTEYESITVANPTEYKIDKLNVDIERLLKSDSKLEILKEIVPEFNHNKL